MKADRLTETARMQHAASHSRLRCGLRVAGVSALMTLNHQLPRDRQRV